jgi:hypothetical protein
VNTLVSTKAKNLAGQVRVTGLPLGFAASVALVPTLAAAAEANAPLTLERTIAPDNVSGRIDHMAIGAASPSRSAKITSALERA